MSDEGIITPIGAPRPQGPAKAMPIAASAKRSLRRDVDRVVAVLAALTALVVFGLAAYFFYGFMQTDQGFWTLASAFGLCFGVAALAYLPCSYLARSARQAAKGQAARKAFALSLLLMLPWVCVSLILIGFSALPKVYGFLALFLSLVFSIWAFKRMFTSPKV